MKSLLLLLTLFLQAILFANATPPKLVLIGEIIDSEKKHPIEYATIRLYKSSDSLMVSGGVSDSLGKFRIELNERTSYYAVINSIGFKEKLINNIDFSEEKLVDLGKVGITIDYEQLDEVIIESEYNNIDYRLDKKVVNVGNQITSSAGSAVDVLENIPSVNVDIDGNVSLRGSTGFLVLINGKPSILDATDALRQIPASSIDQIEVITNPSAKYIPDGVGGIINIILKKNLDDGFSGIINGNVGSFGKYGIDGLLNYKKNGVSFNVGGEYNQRKRIIDEEERRETIIDDTTSYQNAKGIGERSRGGWSVRTGLDWDISKNDYFSIGATVGDFNMSSSSDMTYTTYKDPYDTTLNEIVNGLTKRGGLYVNANLNYVHKFKSKKEELSFQGTYGYRNMKEFNESFLYSFIGSPVQDGSRLDEVGPSHRTDIRLDYSKPFYDGKFGIDVGGQFRYNLSGDDINLFYFDTLQNDLIEDPSKSNQISYTRYIPALYAIFKGEVNSFGYQAGLRSEYTFREVNSISQNQKSTIDRFDFFPSVHLSYKFPNKFQMMASYTRRINRPRGWNLEPFITWTDLFSVRQGNPDLLPEYIESFELNMIQSWKKIRLSVETYYRLTNNVINRISSVYQENVILTSYENVGRDHSLGAEVMANFQLFKWWELSLNGNGYFYRIEGQTNGNDFMNQSLNWTARLSMTFKVVKSLRFQIDGRYNSETVTSQGKNEDYFVFNLGIKADFLKKSLSVSGQVRDLFATGKRVSTIDDNGLNIYRYRFNHAPQLAINITYRFNNFKQKKKLSSDDGGF